MAPLPQPPAAEAQAFLGATRLFAALDAEARQALAARLAWEYLQAGEILCREGDPGDALYLVASGRLVVVREAAGAGGGGAGVGVTERPIRDVTRGESVGELALLTGAPRSATVRAARDSVMARLGRQDFEEAMLRHPQALLALARQLAGWIDPQRAPRSQSKPLTVAVVAAPDGGDRVPRAPASWAADLAGALAAHGSVALVDARALDEACGAGAATSATGSALDARAASWLSELESRHRFVLYDGRGAGPEWIRRCLRQADRLLLLAPGGEPPPQGGLGALGEEIADAAAREPVEEELVLVYPDSPGAPGPRGTGAWLDLRPFVRHHHLRPGDPADLARLARFVAGRAVGVVLGGGGARGLAHIGVLRALAEAGVPIDRVGGASMGAIVGAQFARGGGWAELVALNRRGWIDIAPHKYYTLPLVSILSNAKAEVMLDEWFRGGAIEDLWTSFFCVSTNLSRTEIVVHRRGSLRRWLGASMSLPGVTPPRIAPGGDLLVDGGVLDNLPADVMRALGPGPIVAVDVSSARDVRADPSWEDSPTPWQLLALRARRRRAPPRPFPGILRLITRAALLASDVYAKQAKREVELFLDVPMEDFDFFAMEQLEAIVEHGYEWTRAQLATADLSWLPPKAGRT